MRGIGKQPLVPCRITPSSQPAPPQPFQERMRAQTDQVQLPEGLPQGVATCVGMSGRMSLLGGPAIAQNQVTLISGLPFINGINELTK